MSTKILTVTGCRSDYDLLSGLYQKIHQDPALELGLIVCGAHLAPSYGSTVNLIMKDGLPIIATIESLLDSNSRAGRIKSLAICLQDCIQAVEAFHPDVIMYQGDREEVMVGALLGAYMKIPTIHFLGGDHASDGSVDNPVRHAVSKLSSLHFVAHKTHRERLIRMGETERRIFVVGSPQLDKFRTTPLWDKKKVLQQLGRPMWDHYALLIYHPVYGQEDQAADQFEEILQALREERIRALVSHPNSDAGSRHVISVIRKYRGDENFCFYESVGRDLFVNMMRHAQFMIGNSSAGIYEAPMIPLAAINVGIRQKDRLAAENVLFVDHGVPSIRDGIRTVLHDSFQRRIRNVKSPYGDGTSIEKVHQLLRTIPFADYTLKHEDPLK